MVSRYRIEYLPVAEEDLLDIFDYIKDDNPGATSDFIERMDESISKLALFPELGMVPKDDHLRRMGYRMLIIDDYLVFYVLFDEIVEIRRIIHGSRRYSFLVVENGSK